MASKNSCATSRVKSSARIEGQQVHSQASMATLARETDTSVEQQRDEQVLAPAQAGPDKVDRSGCRRQLALTLRHILDLIRPPEVHSPPFQSRGELRALNIPHLVTVLDEVDRADRAAYTGEGEEGLGDERVYRGGLGVGVRE
jgi:hypothetical protein